MAASNNKSRRDGAWSYGTINLSTGVYEGEIKNGKANGGGTCKYNNADVYEGN